MQTLHKYSVVNLLQRLGWDEEFRSSLSTNPESLPAINVSVNHCQLDSENLIATIIENLVAIIAVKYMIEMEVW